MSRLCRLDADLKALQAKSRTLEEGGQKLAQRQQQIASLRQNLKTRDNELAAVREQAANDASEKEALRVKVAQAEGRVAQLERAAVANSSALASAKQTTAAANKPASQTDRQTEERLLQTREIAELKSRVTSLGLENAKLTSQLSDARAAAGSSQAAGAQAPPGLQVELRRLKEENDRLKQELSAFDLDFFEEIENLKFAHAEAIRKLRMYEGSAPLRR